MHPSRYTANMQSRYIFRSHHDLFAQGYALHSSNELFWLVIISHWSDKIAAALCRLRFPEPLALPQMGKMLLSKIKPLRLDGHFSAVVNW